MANLRISNGKKRNAILNLKIVVQKLQKSLSLGKRSVSHIDKYGGFNDSKNVSEDVKKGHFAVIAMDGYDLKRFVVPLTFLTHPLFLKLLDHAAEEYGFDHEGALMVPCRPSELERILGEQWMVERDTRVGDNCLSFCSSITFGSVYRGFLGLYT